MKEEYKRKIFKLLSLLYLRDLRQTALWLTKDQTDSDGLIYRTLDKAYRVWQPRICEHNFKVLLFQILTELFFNGAQRKSDPPITEHGRHPGLRISHNRLSLIDDEYRIIPRRAIVRSPIEVRFVEILSTIGRFSNSEIAKIIGVKMNGVESKSFKGSRFLQEQMFVYGEG